VAFTVLILRDVMLLAAFAALCNLMLHFKGPM
jgi:hypothetical protein